VEVGPSKGRAATIVHGCAGGVGSVGTDGQSLGAHVHRYCFSEKALSSLNRIEVDETI